MKYESIKKPIKYIIAGLIVFQFGSCYGENRAKHELIQNYFSKSLEQNKNLEEKVENAGGGLDERFRAYKDIRG